MNEILVNLVKLQQIDAQIAFYKNLEDGSTEKLNQAREKLTEAESELQSLNQRLEETSGQRRELEAETIDLGVKAASNQERQLKAKNNDEYRALLKEADFLRQTTAAKEDETIKLMEEGDRLEAEIVAKTEALDELKAEYEAKAQEINQALSHGRQEHEALETRRRELTGLIPRGSLNQYKTIFSARAGQAVAPVEDGLCLACYLSIPPQSYNELQRNNNIIICSNCNRILYWKDHPDFQEGQSE